MNSCADVLLTLKQGCTDVWVVYAPYTGAVLYDSSVPGTTTTSCLQEALNYCAANGCNLKVVGASEQRCVCTASISGNTLDVSHVESGTIALGMAVFDQRGAYPGGIAPGNYITGFVTGKGGVGTYTISNSQTVASETMYLSSEGPVMGVTSTINVPPMRFWQWTMYGVTIDFGTLATDGIVFDSLANSNVEWTATQLVYRGNGAALHFHPRNAVPGDPTYGIGICTFYMPQSIAVYGNVSRCVLFTPDKNGQNDCSIGASEFTFGELNGGPSPRSIGLEVDNSINTDGAQFFNNIITAYEIHECTWFGALIGTRPQSGTGCIRGNEWHLGGSPVAGQAFIVTYGCNDLFFVNINNSGLSKTIGMYFQDGASGNSAMFGSNDCATPVAASSTPGANPNRYVLNGADFTVNGASILAKMGNAIRGLLS